MSESSNADFEAAVSKRRDDPRGIIRVRPLPAMSESPNADYQRRSLSRGRPSKMRKIAPAEIASDLDAILASCHAYSQSNESSDLIRMKPETTLSIPVGSDGQRLSLSSDSARKKRKHAVAEECEKESSPAASEGAARTGHRGKRSVKAMARRQRKRSRQFVKKVRLKRNVDLTGRYPHVAKQTDAAPGVTNARVCFFKDQWLGQDENCSDAIADFYRSNRMGNQWVEVSEDPNVSNLEGKAGGGKGVFALKRIPKGTFICPYLGKYTNLPCRPGTCAYDMELRKGHYVCSKAVKYDPAYLMCNNASTEDFFKCENDRGYFKGAVRCEEECPENYGRYVNSLSPSQLEAGYKFNCRFSIFPEDKIDIRLIALRDIQAGEELLASYGSAFVIE